MNEATKEIHSSEFLDDSLHEDLRFLDVRTPGEFSESHIQGSDNVPLADLGKWIDEIKDVVATKPIVIVCRTGRRAREATKFLKEHEVENVNVLSGGVVAWQEVGLPLVHGEKGVSLERQVRIAAGLLVLVGVILGLFVDRALFGVSAFVGAGLVFAGITDTCGMAMMLAKMPWNRVDTSTLRFSK